MRNRRLPLLDSALGLFRGEPLAGANSLWADSEIRRLHVTQLDLIEQAGRARLRRPATPRGPWRGAERGIGS